MPNQLPYLFNVVAPIIAPVVARPGQIVAVRVGHPTHAVVALSAHVGPRPWRLECTGEPDYAGLLNLIGAGVLVERTAGGAAELLRAVHSAAAEVAPKRKRATKRSGTTSPALQLVSVR